MHHIEGTAREPTAITTYLTPHSLMTDEEDHVEQAERHWDNYHQKNSHAPTTITSACQ